jgi:TonB family protein
MNMKYASLVFMTLFTLSGLKAQEEKILPVAQEMPVLRACAEVKDLSERKICSDEKIREHVSQHLEYPAAAKAAGEEGFVVVRFVVDEKGKTSDFEVVEDPGYGMGEAAIKAVGKCGKWEPGRNMGKAVKVRMAVPVRFVLPESPDAPAARPDVYVVVDQRPRFHDCLMGDDLAAEQCTFERIMQYMKENLVYPEEAGKKNIAGTVIVKFVVDEQGVVNNPVIEEGIGAGCDAEALRLVKAMPAWTPGKVNGQNVKTEMTLPFKFALPTEKE